MLKVKWRCCLDFWRLNQDIIPDVYNLPNIRDLQDRIGTLEDPKILTKVDWDRAFWQIPLTEESKKYTASTTPYGNFVCNRLPMGVSTSPSIWTRLMNKVIAGMDPFEIMCYIDDLLIVSPNIEAHVGYQEQV